VEIESKMPSPPMPEAPSGPEALSRSRLPKLISTFRDGYGAGQFQRDVIAGLTVAIVALPLSMAIAIASGATPAAGLYAAIVGGFLVSMLGGSRFQIGGPAGAFIVLIASIIERHGYDGLLLATLMGGAILIVMGLTRMGGVIRHVPQPVLVGFTAAIAVIIFASQIRDLLGLTLPGKEPGAILPKLAALWQAGPTINLMAVLISAGVISVILGLRRVNPRLPGLLVAVALAALASHALSLPVETIGTRFGGIPDGLPYPAVPPFGVDRMLAVLPDAFAIALLGGIESLLSAVVADGMTGRRHRADAELVAQGVANMATALFGGLCVTGTIARTATNIRAGAASPLAGMLHSVFLLAFMMLAAPLASHVPLAALAGVLAVVAWNMADRHEVMSLLRGERGKMLVLLLTFGLTALVDLMIGIAAGCALAFILHRLRKQRREA
jgi:SulP family sulfate permease